MLAGGGCGAVDRGRACGASDLGVCGEAGFKQLHSRGPVGGGGKAGRPAFHPQLLISLWVYGYGQGVGSARAIEQWCEWDPAYQWLTGARVVNAHTLSDFRVKHDVALIGLLVQSLKAMSKIKRTGG